MTCGYIADAPDSYWTTCYKPFTYPCGINWCRTTWTYPCGIRWCVSAVRYPCGIRWCRRWGVRYPCGILMCTFNVTWPCGIRTCTLTFSYPCGLRYCKGSIPYPCQKQHMAQQWCYDFSYIGEHCYVGGKKIYGCCDGVEYEVTGACLGWFENYTTGSRVCGFDKPKQLGPCREGYSLPQGMQVPPISTPDNSAVSALTSTGSNVRAKPIRFSKLGSCTRCYMISLVATACCWVVFIAGRQFSTVMTLIALLSALTFTTPVTLHTLSWLLKRILRIGPCPCKAAEYVAKNHHTLSTR